MTCQKCEGTAEHNLPGLGEICSKCFLDVMERRAKMELKRAGEVKKGEKVLILDDGSKEAKVAELFMRALTASVPCSIVVSTNATTPHDKLIIPWDADDEALEALQHICESKPLQNNGIKLLRGLLDSEVALVAKLKNIPLTEKPASEAKKLLDHLETLHPGTKFSLGKSLDDAQ